MTEEIVVPFEALLPETLEAVLEEFVLREGTDYGPSEISLTSKVASVRRQLEAGEAKIVFDAESETCTLVVQHPKAKKSLSGALGGTGFQEGPT